MDNEPSVENIEEREKGSSEEKGHGILHPEHYDQPPVPREDEVEVFMDNGVAVATNIKPRKVGVWSFEYFYTPVFKAQMARSILILFVSLALSMTLFIGIGVTWYSVITNIVFALMLVITILNYLGIGLFNRPSYMPSVLSFLISSIPIKGYSEDKVESIRKTIMGDSYRTPEERLAEEQSSQENDDSGDDENTDDHDVVDLVEDVNSQGHSSPATILTRWMRLDDVRWNEDDLYDHAGGLLTRHQVKMLLKDSSSMWEDDDVLSVIAQLTDTAPEDWSQVYTQWKE